MATKFLLLLLLLLTGAAAAADDTASSFLQSTKLLPRHHTRREKLSHFRFYCHDILSGRNPTSMPVAGAGAATTKTSSTYFGAVVVIDDPLTSGPDMSSHLVGRSQGLYGSAAQQTVGLIMAMNFAFTEGKYNGSTLTVIGRNEVFKHVREMPIVGGSGVFRLARGYVQARTHSFDTKSGDACVRYDVFVIHH